MSAPRATAARPRMAATLVELLVVLAVLGVTMGIAGLAFHRTRSAPSAGALVRDRIATARREAIATGRTVSTTVVLDGQPRAVTAYADGRVLADSLPSLDVLSDRSATRADHARP